MVQLLVISLGHDLNGAISKAKTLTQDNVNRLFSLYGDYQDVIDYAKIVTIDDVKEHDYTLSVNAYIAKTQKNTTSPSEVRRQYLEAYQNMINCENLTRELLKKGGYIDSPIT